MIMEKNFRNSEKQIRPSYALTIHNLFIFNKAGICIYGRNFTHYYSMESNLITSFFAALGSFTKEVIGNKFKTIEMGDVKFVIIKNNTFNYALLCDATLNVIFLENIVSEISTYFIKYITKNNVNTDIESVKDENLNALIDSIIRGTKKNNIDLLKEEEIKDYLKKLKLNDEVEGAVLLTDVGKVVFSTINGMELRNLLKEVDFRVKICNNSILKLFYTSKHNHFIFSEYVADLYFVILVFDINIKFGVAEFYLHKVVENINKILNN